MNPTALLSEGLSEVILLAGPIFGVLAGVGLVVGVLQAATQINDPALGFLPRAAAFVAVVWLSGAWMMDRMAALVANDITRMTGNGP